MIEDSEILRLFKAGQKEEAFNQVVKNYGERLYWHIRHIVNTHEDADDLLQDTFVKAWNALERFRGEAGLYTWLYRIATNEVLSFLGRKRVTADVSLSQEPARVAGLLKTERGFDGDRLQRLLRAAIDTLPPKQQMVFCERYYNETPYEDISKALGTSVGALKASYHHAYNKVLEYVKSRIDIDY